MTDQATRYTVHGDIAVVTLDNPPVNGLGLELRQGLKTHIEQALSDPAVKGVVVIGAGKMFCGGADIRQFNTPKASMPPRTADVIKSIEAADKPVVAAIHGNALGGGLELALGCHYRICTAESNLGLPEVKLGLLPGGGGTQRLPRLVGVEKALAMIVSGKPAKALAALKMGLVSEVVEGDLLEAALRFARKQAADGAKHPVIATMTAAADDADELFGAARTEASRRQRGFPAPLACIACVEAATRLPIDEGLQFERDQFMTLVNGPESKAQRYLFFAEREARKIPDIPAQTRPRPLNSVGILGAGTMGAGIAMSFASAGLPVTLFETNQQALDRGIERIRSNYGATVKKGRLSQAAMDKAVGLITPTLEQNDLGSADLVIEAVFEEMDVKKDVFKRLDAVCKPGAVLASNTSRLDLNEIAAVTSRPQDVIGMHFFSPANVMRLLEVVRGEKSAPDVIETAMQAGQIAGKLPVLVGVCEGFVGNRMLGCYSREAEFLLEEGATPQQVDGVLRDFGLAMGRFQVADLAGLDIGWAGRKRLAPTRPAHLRYSRVSDRICEMGRFGQKTQAGFYLYKDGSRTPTPDPEIEALIRDCAAQAGIEQREISDQEIIERCIYALVNEGANILDEGVAARASDIDLIYINGYGFPGYRGGPLFYADTVGLDKVYQRICEFEKVHGEFWKPAP
ncbi:MAG: 3-hydroxyacyl-CoA dehydrogenase NAD-binding domain-containing protein, partial [Burkholderiaceae bacterium]